MNHQIASSQYYNNNSQQSKHALENKLMFWGCHQPWDGRQTDLGVRQGECLTRRAWNDEVWTGFGHVSGEAPRRAPASVHNGDGSELRRRGRE
jgi:hypothetical protein